MIFIAKNADFSANRIGVVPITYDARTEEVLTAYNNTSLTVNQKDKLNSLLRGLNDNGILTKISHLYLPVLAPTLDKSFVNVAKAELPISVVPNSGAYALNSTVGGIYNSVTGTALNIPINASENLSLSSFHYLAFNTNKVDSISAYPSAISSPSNIIMNFSGGLAGDTQMGSSTTVAGQNIHLKFPEGMGNKSLHSDQSLKGISITSLSGIKLLRRSSVADFPYDTPFGSDVSVPSVNLNLAGYASSRMIGSHGLISIGKGLSTNELEIYNTLANDLMTAMGVSVYSI